jgi:hypothetical protein
MPPDPAAPFRPAATVAEAEQFAREHDVAADYGHYLIIANLVNEGLAILGRHGISVAVPITIDPYGFVRGGQVQRDFVGTHDERDGIIRFNPLARHWSDPMRESREQYELRWWASDHPLAPVFHEVGHALHLSPARSCLLPTRDWASEEERRLARRVSVVAESAPTEFVAEVFRVLFAGGQVDPDALALYERLGGIIP